MLASRFSAKASCVSFRSSGSSSASSIVIIFPSIFMVVLWVVWLVVFGMCGRQCEDEGGAGTRLAFGRDVAAVIQRNFFDDGQPHAVALELGARMQPLEDVEN